MIPSITTTLTYHVIVPSFPVPFPPWQREARENFLASSLTKSLPPPFVKGVSKSRRGPWIIPQGDGGVGGLARSSACSRACCSSSAPPCGGGAVSASGWDFVRA